MLSPCPAPFLPGFLVKNSGMETGILFSWPVFSIQDRAPYKKVSPGPATCFNDPNQRRLPSLNCRWRLRSADPEVGAWWHAIMRLLQLRRSPCTTRYSVDCITGLRSLNALCNLGFPDRLKRNTRPVIKGIKGPHGMNLIKYTWYYATQR